MDPYVNFLITKSFTYPNEFFWCLLKFDVVDPSFLYLTAVVT